MVCEVAARASQIVETIEWTQEDFVDRLATVLRIECKSQPVLILNDMVEQHYRKERIPKLTGMDKKGIILRRLNNIFNEYQFRSFLAPKGGSGKTTSKGPMGDVQDVYLFAAFPETESIRKVFEALRKSYSPVLGIGLLPVESAAMINSLAEKILDIPKKPQNTIWTVFLGQQSSGALRQIVTKNGEFALTRITPIVDTDLNPGAWVKDVAREFQSTMGYLTRFGLTQNDELNLIVIAGEKCHTLLHQAIESYTHLIPMTVEDAAAKLGIRINRQVEQRYADLLHVGWQSKQSKLVMPVRSTALDQLSKPRMIANYGGYTLLLLLAGVTFYSSYNLQSYYKASANLSMAEEQKAQIEQIYQQDIARKEEMGINFKLVKGSLDAEKAIKVSNSWPYPVLKAIYLSLNKDLKITELAVNTTDGPIVGDVTIEPIADLAAAATAGTVDSKSTYTITLSFPKELSGDTSNRMADEFRSRLATILTSYTVTIPKKITDLSYVAAVKNEAGIGGASADTEDLKDYTVDVVIEAGAGGGADPAAAPPAEGAPQ